MRARPDVRRLRLQLDFGARNRFKPLDPAQFLDLYGYPPFPAAVLLPDFLGAPAQLAEEPGVLHRDYGLRRKDAGRPNKRYGEAVQDWVGDGKRRLLSGVIDDLRALRALGGSAVGIDFEALDPDATFVEMRRFHEQVIPRL